MAEAPPIESIKRYVSLLEDPKITRTARLALFRGIIDAAHQAHEVEVQQLDSLNSVKADLATEVSIV
jgi:hypothetical protein